MYMDFTGTIINLIVFALSILKYIILASVLISWLPLLGVRVPPYHPVVTFIKRVSDPILAPFRPYARVGMMDLSPIIVFFLIGIIQNLLLGGFGIIAEMLARIIVLIIGFSVHEYAHALTAYRLGDSTAKNQGRLTLDPRRHLDVLGSLMLLTVGFGWAKPVPVNPNYLRNGPKAGMAMVAVAGPLSNLALAIIAAAMARVLVAGGLLNLTGSPIIFYILPSLGMIFIVFVSLNILLLFFNLLPIAPLDGFRVVAGLLPYPTSHSFRQLEPAGPLILLLLLFFGQPILSTLIGTPTSFVTRLLLPL
jgi:Zn-dependent protease